MANNNDGTINQSNAQAQVQDNLNAIQLGPESRRKLTTVTFTANSTQSCQIPVDTVIKRINLFFSSSVTATYASGAFVLSPMGQLARICPNFTLIADSSRTIKVLDLYMARCLQALAYGGFGRRAYQTGAGLYATTRQPTTEWLAGTVTGGATTQDLVVEESLDIMFENYFAYETGRDVSLLYTKNLSTCFMYFNFGSLDAMLNAANAALSFSQVDISIIPTIIENRDASIANGAFDFTETVVRNQYSSQVTQSPVVLNTGAKMVGLGVFAQNGDAARLPSDIAVTDMVLKINGSQEIQTTNLKQLSDDNKGRFGVSDDQFATGVHALGGFGYMNLLKNGDIRSGLDARLTSGISQLQLFINTASASGVNAGTYTNPIQVSVVQQQMIPVPIKA